MSVTGVLTPYFDSLAIGQSPYTKDTSSQHWYAPGFKVYRHMHTSVTDSTV